jgi:hypothetical protein
MELKGSRRITAEMAILLACAFQTTPGFWINLQARYDLEIARSTMSVARLSRAAKVTTKLRSESVGTRLFWSGHGPIDPRIEAATAMRIAQGRMSLQGQPQSSDTAFDRSGSPPAADIPIRAHEDEGAAGE